MKRLLVVLLIGGIIAACATFWPTPPPILTVYAQTLPITKTVAWDANPVSDAVTGYVVRLDGVVVGSPTGLTQAVTFTTAGAHTLAVRAVNLWGESVDTTLAVNVVVPVKPTNVRLQ